MVTYRLADSLPADAVQNIERTARTKNELRQRVQRLLDAGYGSCILRRADIASLVIENWRHFDGARYRLDYWVVMPNHVHVLLKIHPGHSLSRIVHGWKSFTGKAIAARCGTRNVWQADYWDRFIRDEAHYEAVAAYIVSNPVSAGLVQQPENWPWSSVRSGEQEEE